MFLYKERDENERQRFIEKISKIKDKQMIYVDECGIDTESEKDYGWSKKGEKIIAEKVENRSKRKRISFIGALNHQKRELFAPFYSENYTNTEVFLTWVKEVLVPELKPLWLL